MEALSGVASVISIVTLALQSTKVIYEVGSSISHSSDDIDRLVRATGNLEKLLEIIKRVALHAESTNSVAEGKLLEELKQPVEHCANTLDNISAKLVKLQKDSKDGRWEKTKKYARVYLDTKGISEIWNTINHYVELLGACLGNASVAVGLYNAQEAHRLRDEFLAASRDSKVRFDQTVEFFREQRALPQAGWNAFQAEFHRESIDARVAAATQIQGIADIKTGQQQFGEAITVGYERIADIRADVQNLRARMEVMENFRSISDRLEAEPSMTSEQSSNLQNLVGMLSGVQLETRSGRQEEPECVGSQANFTVIGSTIYLEMINDPEIERMMGKICHFTSTRTRIGAMHSKNAQSLIEDIGRLLGLVMQYSRATSLSRDELPRKRKKLCDYEYSQLETVVQTREDLAKAKRVLTASERVRISNKESWPSNNFDETESSVSDRSQDRPLANIRRRRRAPIAHIQDTMRSWVLRHGRLNASFKTMFMVDKEDSNTESADEAFAAKVVITPTTTTTLSNFQIIIDLASKTYQDRTVHFTPTLTFRAMIPDYSEVFEIVQRGSVKKLKKLLSSGAASLGDCDSEGRSLLNFALYRCRRKMTAFLIQSGADVDSLEARMYDWDPSELPIKPMSRLGTHYDCGSVDEDLERAEGCYKLLLDADSDLTSVIFRKDDAGYYWSNAFSEALTQESLVKLKALIDIGEPFISLESTGDRNAMATIPLHLLAHCDAMDYGTNCQITDKIALLLSRGANVDARNHRGETSLHVAFSNYSPHEEPGLWLRRIQRHPSRSMDILILMCSAGADLCAIDNQGRSVSDAAFEVEQEVAWTEALKYCGIDINDVLARPNVDPAKSTALSSPYNKRPKSVTSKLSLAEYLKRRKPCAPSSMRMEEALISSSEDDDSEDEDHEDDESDYGDWDDEGDNEADDESESEDSAEDTNRLSNGTKANCVPENKKGDFTYQEREKAKLD